MTVVSKETRDGLVYIIAKWSAVQELPQDEVVDVVYRVLAEVGNSPTYYGVDDLKKEISNIYAEVLGYDK